MYLIIKYSIFFIIIYYLNIMKYKYKNLHNLQNYDNFNNLNDLITEYYNIDKYDFDNNYKRLEEYILKKLKKNNKIFKFDFSMINDKLYSDIENIINNHKKAFLYKIDDNYIIKYRNYNNYQKSNNLKINLNNIFYNDLIKLINLKKINNIIDIIDVDIIKKKLNNSLLYAKNIKSCIYDNYYKNINNDHIIQNYLDTLNSEDYTIYFNIKSENRFDTNHNTEEFKNVLNKLENINTNINNIKLIKSDIDNLYNISYINKIYKNKKDMYIKMDNITNRNFELIEYESQNDITLNQFTNQIVEFLNRFLKKKITYIINSIFYDYIIS